MDYMTHYIWITFYLITITFTIIIIIIIIYISPLSLNLLYAHNCHTSPLHKGSNSIRKLGRMAENKELKVDMGQVRVTSPPSGGVARQGSMTKNNCLCSPTTHEGSFRCRLHRTHSGIQRTKSVNSESKTP
ncbi:hypothetical protein HanRHA438_Chr17g0840351 [Helianthus annuus]|nr:hypothetical protein HanHA300_Chr17g0675931 [Helianthus annuus]KAJ0436142.1 hypothetical protein HanIR_Chr17g0901151 [Helianthus annuus]KAJ0449494.1 hypothetical protein HanHA89_Chr17g0729061 [Helianthus annuus]KAJ0634348.1 hypothetical protein HanLR1_Chr17g0687071 [Helianthus annuus]KAJ0815384.1 hypothetical protein HanPSC8_Chr17g0796861 [Helianthus annuus]